MVARIEAATPAYTSRNQQGPEGSIHAHSTRYIWLTGRSTLKKGVDVTCAMELLLSARGPAEPSLRLLLFSSASRAIYAGAFELSAEFPARSPPLGNSFL